MKSKQNKSDFVIRILNAKIRNDDNEENIFAENSYVLEDDITIYLSWSLRYQKFINKKRLLRL